MTPSPALVEVAAKALFDRDFPSGYPGMSGQFSWDQMLSGKAETLRDGYRAKAEAVLGAVRPMILEEAAEEMKHLRLEADVQESAWDAIQSGQYQRWEWRTKSDAYDRAEKALRALASPEKADSRNTVNLAAVEQSPGLDRVEALRDLPAVGPTSKTAADKNCPKCGWTFVEAKNAAYCSIVPCPMKGETEMSELKPCPFCGANTAGVAATQDEDDNSRKWSVLCSRCGASVSLYCESEAEAINDWNRRAPAAGREWLPIAEYDPEKHGKNVIICVQLERGPVVGEAHRDDTVRAQWWWANQDAGDYYAEPIYGEPLHWQPMPLPPPPSAEPGEGK